MTKIIILVHLAAPVLGLLVNTLTQLLICRLMKSTGLLKSIVFGFGAGFAAVAACDIAWYQHATPDVMQLTGQTALNLLTYIALGYGYFHFVNLGETARRIRLLRELLDSKEGLTQAEILERYNAADIVSARLQRMLRNRQIVLHDGRFYIQKPALLYMGKTINILKRILLRQNMVTDKS